MKKKALITGIYGQDGSYLCELLSSKDYEVFGIIKEPLSDNGLKIKQYLLDKNIRPQIYNVRLSDYHDLKSLLLEINPDEIYHLAAIHVSSEGIDKNKNELENKLYQSNILATSNILSISYDCLKNVRLVTAGSCLMFDNSETNIQNETTSFNSNSLYGLAKIAENNLVKYYRSKGLHASMAILYNHESSRRADNFVTKKIVKNMVALSKGEITKFTLGNLDSLKDWGYAKDYVLGMYLMNQQEIAEDYILSSGIVHSIKDFVEICADVLGIKNWENHIEINSNIIDRKINCTLLGDSNKAQKQLSWTHSIDFEQLVKLMINNEINNVLE